MKNDAKFGMPGRRTRVVVAAVLFRTTAAGGAVATGRDERTKAKSHPATCNARTLPRPMSPSRGAREHRGAAVNTGGTPRA